MAADEVTIRAEAPSPSAYFRLFESTGWNDTYGVGPDELGEVVSRSWAVVCAYRGARLVGVGRAVSDGLLYAVLFDVIVDPADRRQGVGTRIVEELLARCREEGIRDVLLFSARGTEPFYRRFGFSARPSDAPGMILRLASEPEHAS